MERYYTKTFFRFALAFFGILLVAFAVVIVASPKAAPRPVDNLAQPR